MLQEDLAILPKNLWTPVLNVFLFFVCLSVVGTVIWRPPQDTKDTRDSPLKER